MNKDERIINKVVELSGDYNKLSRYAKKNIYPLELKKANDLLYQAFKRIK